MKENQRAGKTVGGVDGGTLQVQVLPLRVGGNQPVQVAGLELVGVLGQGRQVADPVVAGPGPEYIPEGEGGQGGIAAGAAAVNRQTRLVHRSLPDQVQCPVNAVIHVHDAPASLEPVPVGPSVAGTAAVVHVQHRNTPAGPILDGQVQGNAGGCGWPAVALDQQGRLFPVRGRKVPVLRRVVKGVGGQPVLGGKLNSTGRRQVAGVHGNRTRLLQYFKGEVGAIGQVKAQYGNRLGGRTGAENRLSRRHLEVGAAHFGVGQGDRLQAAGSCIQRIQLPGPPVVAGADDAFRRGEPVGSRAEDPLGFAKLQLQRRRGRLHRTLPPAVQVPPAGAVRNEVEDTVGRPFRLKYRLGEAAGYQLRRLRQVKGTVRRYRRRPKLGAVPGHIGVIPGKPG